MKIAWTRRLIGRGPLAPSTEWADIRQSAMSALTNVVWPPEAAKFSIQPERKSNGVTPIKRAVQAHLQAAGWDIEERWPIPDMVAPGRMDGAKRTSHGLVAFEWETGNVASSHRSLNKMCLGLHHGTIAGGIMAVSAKDLAQFLTDRIGTAEEIQAYFPLWQSTPCERGVLEIIVVTYDRLDPQAPLIPKASTGRAV